MWTHGGFELNCELNVSHGFPFVESGHVVDDGPPLPTCQKDVQQCGGVWSGVYCHENLVFFLSTVSRCGSVLSRLPGDLVLSRQYGS